MQRGFGYQNRRNAGGPFSPASLFAGGVNGAWYDPSDSTTLFSDRAGTTPCGTPGGGSVVPVGLMLDKSGNGNHATAANDTTARPELRARVNLLTFSEQFDNAAWQKIRITLTTNSTLAPNNTLTADTATISVTGTYDTVRRTSAGLIANTQYSWSVFAKAGATNWLNLRFWDAGVNGINAWFNLATGTIGTIEAGCTASISDEGNGWYRCSITRTVGSSIAFNELDIGVTDGDNTLTGTVGASIIIWGAQLTATNEFPANTYQRIVDANTYDAVGFPRYFVANGTSSAMSTPGNIPFATVTSDGQARRNLLLNPTQFDVTSSWTTDNATVTANTGTAPDGTTTADTLTSSGAALVQRIRQAATQTGQVTFSVYAKTGTAQFLQLLNASDGNCFANFDLSAGTVGTSGTGSTSTISNAGSGWYRCTITYTLAASSNWQIYIAPSASATYGQSFTATVAALQVWGAQLETGSTATAFQNIGTDKVTVFAGVRKQSDAAGFGVVNELGDRASISTASWSLTAPGTAASATYLWASAGSNSPGGGQYVEPTGFAAPRTNVLTGIGDIGADTMILRANGVQAGSSSFDQGTGNYANRPLFIGARNNSTLFFNGNIYSIIVVGSAVSAGNISSTEQWVAGKVGITI